MATVKAAQDEAARIIAEQKKQAAIEAANRKKIVDDSIVAVKSEQARLADELAQQKKLAAEARKKAVDDSIASAKIAEEQAARILAEQKKQAAIEAANRKKIVDDSIGAVKIEQARIANELAEQKRRADEAAVVRKKAVNDSVNAANAERARIAREMADRNAGTAALAKEIQATTTAKTSNKPQPVVEPENIVIRESDTPTANMKAMYFAKNSYDINATTNIELKQILQALQADPNSHLNIYALASTGENNPRQVSLRRSDMVLRYFIQAGIPIERVRSFYYGNNLSRNGCTNPNCPEELLQQNRCVVYEVVKK